MTQEYEKLKKQILLNVVSSERHSQLLMNIKDYFKNEINSPRRFEQITSFLQLFKVLEMRDVLAEDKAESLKVIVQTLPNQNELLSQIDQYIMSRGKKEHIGYYVLENNKENNAHNSLPYYTKNPYANVSDLKLKNMSNVIIQEIGTGWKDLARNLKIRERDIDEVDTECNELAQKAKLILEIYTKEKDSDKWFLILCEALEKSRRKDLRNRLQEIMSGNI